jgi:hypothetical protein
LVLSGNGTARYGDSVIVAIAGGSGMGAMNLTVTDDACEVVSAGSTSVTLRMLDGVGRCTLNVVKAADGNYSAASSSFEVLLSPRSLFIDAIANEKTFGEVDPNLTYSLRGLAPTDDGTIPGTGEPTCQRASGNDAGSYVITCSMGSYSPGSGYQIKAGSTAMFIIEQRPVTVSAPSLTVRFAAAVSPLIPTYSGLPEGIEEPSLPAACQTAATASSSVGTYRITCSLTDANYQPAYVDGTYTVVQAPQTVTLVAPASATYGQSIEVTAFSSAGLEVAVSVEGPCRASNDVEAWDVLIVSGAGNCVVTATVENDSNYEHVSAESSTVIKTKATASVNAVSDGKIYGDTDAPIGYRLTGLVASDTRETVALSGNVVCEREAGEDVGNYEMSCDIAGLASYDYEMTSGVPTNFVISPRPLFVTASNTTQPFGSLEPSISASYTGLANGDIATATAPTCGTAVNPTTASGVYASTCSGAADPNYVITYVAGVVAVVRSAQTLSFPPVSRETTVVSPEASSSLPVALAASGSCTVTSAGTGQWSINTLPFGGECRLTAVQDGDSNFEAAPTAIRTFDVLAVTPEEPTFDPAPVVPGQAVMNNVDGTTTPVAVQSGVGSVSVSVNGITFTFATKADDGAPILVAGGEVPMDGGGFMAGSSLQWWMMSTPKLVATMSVDADGRFEGSIAIPDDLDEGNHTLRVEGLGPNGSPLAISVGVSLLSSMPSNTDNTATSPDGPPMVDSVDLSVAPPLPDDMSDVQEADGSMVSPDGMGSDDGDATRGSGESVDDDPVPSSGAQNTIIIIAVLVLICAAIGGSAMKRRGRRSVTSFDGKLS